MRAAATSRLVACASLLALVACGRSPEEARQAPSGDPRPDVLLISLDSVRRDGLGCYARSIEKPPAGPPYPSEDGESPTPHLDRLAAEGLLFENAFSTTSWTLPAHATLMTGEPELVHGLEQDGLMLREELATLAERLGRAGYRTAGVYSGPYLDPRYGLARGFERYRAGYGPELASAMTAADRARERLHGLAEDAPEHRRAEAVGALADAERAVEIASHRDSSSRVVTDLALEELAAAAEDGRPGFLFVHYFDAHYDYLPPGHDTSIGANFVRYLADPESGRGRSPDLWQLQVGEVSWIDSQLARLLDALAESGRAANTLVIVVSDHGDEFLEHQGFGHRRTLYDEVLRVPLLMRWPDGLPDGERRRAPVSLADVAPSVLALVEGRTDEAPLLSDEPRGVLGRLVLSPTGEREDVRVLESFHWGTVKILRERPLGLGATLLRWIDLDRYPREGEQYWSLDFRPARAAEALERFIAEYELQLARRRQAPRAERAEDLLSALRGLGYAGEEARVGALEDDGIVLPAPAQIERQL